MPDNLTKSLIPSEDEVKRIIAQMVQIEPTQIPVLLLQVELARLMLKFIDRLEKDLSESIERLESEINRKPKE